MLECFLPTRDWVGQFIVVREIVGGLFEFLKIKNSRQNF
jgi:hypothetical protein